jgi:hypothetical protein
MVRKSDVLVVRLPSGCMVRRLRGVPALRKTKKLFEWSAAMNSDSKTLEMPPNRKCSKCGWLHAVGSDCPPENAVYEAGSAFPATPDKCPTCGLVREIGLCGNPWHSGAAPATKPLDALFNKLPLQDEIERVLLRRVYEKKVEGYTLDTAYEIAALVAGARAAAESKEK